MLVRAWRCRAGAVRRDERVTETQGARIGKPRLEASGEGRSGESGSDAGGRRLRERLPLVGGWWSRAAEPGKRGGAPTNSKATSKATSKTDSKTGHQAYVQDAPLTAMAPDQPVPQQGKDRDPRFAQYDEDAPYEASDQDIPHVEYDHDTTFEPYDFPPAEPTPEPPAEPSPESPSPDAWHDDASRTERWAAMKEASDPPEAP
ncbi:hypothetical protein ADL12_14965 [Streptomyces regalis]|uniref:Uncharacterized protein n=1 Tax=Streptomyces regalis TaxID=68262 RepID=A0A0X3V501_9ACTN|nr:hypothetical protein ADL12_14965 [Streptomyces regalis]